MSVGRTVITVPGRKLFGLDWTVEAISPRYTGYYVMVGAFQVSVFAYKSTEVHVAIGATEDGGSDPEKVYTQFWHHVTDPEGVLPKLDEVEEWFQHVVKSLLDVVQ